MKIANKGINVQFEFGAFHSKKERERETERVILSGGATCTSVEWPYAMFLYLFFILWISTQRLHSKDWSSEGSSTYDQGPSASKLEKKESPRFCSFIHIFGKARRRKYHLHAIPRGTLSRGNIQFTRSSPLTYLLLLLHTERTRVKCRFAFLV